MKAKIYKTVVALYGLEQTKMAESGWALPQSWRRCKKDDSGGMATGEAMKDRWQEQHSD